MTLTENDYWHPSIPDPEACRRLVSQLTEGEYMVLDLMFRGYSRKEIAKIRKTSVKTVANQITYSFKKLCVYGNGSRMQVMAIFRRMEEE